MGQSNILVEFCLLLDTQLILREIKDQWADKCNVNFEICSVCRFVGEMGRNFINRGRKVPYVWVMAEG